MTLIGRRTDTRLRPGLYWTGFLLAYLGLMLVTDILCNTVYALYLTVETHLTLVVFLPLTLLLLLHLVMSIVLALTVIHTHTLTTHDLRGLRRLGRQLTFSAPDRAGAEARYICYARTVEEAREMERMLVGQHGA